MNRRSRKFLVGSGNLLHGTFVVSSLMEERMMRKLVYALTAAAAIAVGVPTFANAGEVYIHGDHGYYDRHDGPRFGFREHERGREFRRDFDRRDYGDRGYGDRDFVVREHRDYY
jgi:hypothetical protein